MNTEDNKTPILMIAGEHSGDMLGAEVIEQLNLSELKFKYFGIGGELMKKLNFESLANIEDLTVIGITGAILKYRHLKVLANAIIEKTISYGCKHVILIDYPGFNLYLAKEFKKRNIKVIFYVSPQIWAWRFKRIFTIKENVDLMLLLFLFEKQIYDEYKINNVFTGHPIISRMGEKFKSEPEVKSEPGSIIVCLMPGSRTGEIKRLLKPILESAKIIFDEMKKKGRKVSFLLPGISKKEESYILEYLNIFNNKFPEIKIQYLFDNSARCIEKSDLVIVASGTATLEVAYFEKPMVIVYKLSYITYWIGKMLVQTRHVGLVNILSGKEICKELIQGTCNSENISEEALKILNDPEYHSEMKNNLKQLRKNMGEGNPASIAANAILKLIRSS